MASPVTVGTTPGEVARRNRRRAKLYLQNNGATILYFKRQSSHLSGDPSATNYDFLIGPAAATAQSEIIVYESTDALRVVSSAAAGVLAFYDTSFEF